MLLTSSDGGGCLIALLAKKKPLMAQQRRGQWWLQGPSLATNGMLGGGGGPIQSGDSWFFQHNKPLLPLQEILPPVEEPLASKEDLLHDRNVLSLVERSGRMHNLVR
ncbi:UNVERIFIED_CONTAM: hypothetical protein K2H54_060486 [Gekko kuhli]